jgi:hypothetical protein
MVSKEYHMSSDQYTYRGQILKVFDNRTVSWAHTNVHPGMTCRTCTHYALEEDVALPIELDETKAGYRAKIIEAALTLQGVCLQAMPNFLVHNIEAQWGCDHYEGKPMEEQFEDDTLTDDLEGREV